MKKIIFFLLLFAGINFAQELEATVLVNMEQLPNAYKERLTNFQRDIEGYLNNNKFSGDNWQGPKIKCTFNVFFTGGTDQLTYSAQVVVTSQRAIYQSEGSSLMLSILDPKWNFGYEEGKAMYFIPAEFDPLTSFLDYYAFLIIGYDFDSYGPDPLGGTDLYNQALEVAIRGAGGKSKEGWQLESTSYNKRGLVEDLLNANFNQFRHDFMDYHYNGLDLFKENKKFAQDNMAKLIYNLAEKKDKLSARSVLLKVFFDAKSGEFVKYLGDYKDISIFETLRKIDPANISKYDTVFEK